jgi:hypothetical protein
MESENGVADSERQCRQGDAEACHDASIRYMCGVGADRDFAKAASFGAKACELGSTVSCGTAGTFYLGLLANSKMDGARAVPLLQKGCDGDFSQSCNGLALAYWRGLGVPANPGKALELFDVACKQDVMAACANQAFLLATGAPGVPRDPQKAGMLAARACDREQGSGCNVRGLLAATPEERLPFFVHACDLGEGNGCANAASIFLAGQGVSNDLELAKKFFRRACESGNSHACSEADKLGR